MRAKGSTTMPDFVMGDKFVGDKIAGDKIMGNKTGHTGRPPDPDPSVVLFLSANPSNTSPLQLDKERRRIDDAVRYAQAQDRLAIRTADAVRLDDLQHALLRHRPAIAHFSGHGTGPQGVLVLDDFDRPQPVPPEPLGDLFGILRDSLHCVVLNACLTHDQALAIAKHVPCVVGMAGRVADVAAIRFATSFYQAIAFGRSVSEAYDLGRNRLALEGYADTATPILIAGPGVAERTVVAPRPPAH